MIGNKDKIVLLTGATGFIGSYLLGSLLNANYNVVVLVRNNSNLWRIKEFLNNNNLTIYNIDKISLEKIFLQKRINVVIHAAWDGVNTDKRNDIDLQISNFEFSLNVFNVSIINNVNKIISLGSQAEYGKFSGRVTEEYECKPSEYYGISKLYTYKTLKFLCEKNNIHWNWIRIFSIFGEKENENLFLSYVIKKLLMNEDLNVTLCEQKYDYLYISDFCNALLKLLDKDCDGVFNLSSNTSISLKDIITKIKNITNSTSIINYGALEYRLNQCMHMEGDSSKLKKLYDFTPEHFENGIIKLINYYRNKLGNNN